MASRATEPASPDPQTPPISLLSRALLICLSPKEYRLAHERLVKKLPAKLQGHVISPATVQAISESRDQYINEAFRSSLRLFLATGTVSIIAEALAKRFLNFNPGSSFHFRLSLSNSLFLLANRLLYRFFSRLRANLRTEDARPFRKRNPRIAKALSSKYTPAIGASLACFLWGLLPITRVRVLLATSVAFRGVEYIYNALEERGWFRNKPWWLGGWALMPLSCAQLFHAFFFDRETIPGWLSKFILNFSPGYLQNRPEDFAANLHWPDGYETADALAKISELKWPAFVSPILHPQIPNPLPAALQHMAPITSPAHPAVSSLSCALLHPKTPSCLTAYLQQTLLSIPPLARTVTKVAIVLSLLKFPSLILHPISVINLRCRKILSATAILSTALGTAWGSICLFNSTLPRSILRTQRFYLSGALAGMPFMFWGSGGSNFVYFLRLAVESTWNAGVKRGLWRGWKGGELWLLAASWAVIGAILESQPTAISSQIVRKLFAWYRGDGYIDVVDNSPKKKGKTVVIA